MVNINMKLPDDLHRELKVQATLSDSTLKDYVNTILSQSQGGDT